MTFPRLSVELKLPEAKVISKVNKIPCIHDRKDLFLSGVLSEKIHPAQIDAPRSLTDATTGNVENSIKDSRMTIMEPNPKNMYVRIYLVLHKLKMLKKTYLKGLARTLCPMITKLVS